jgi:dCMP deaminase
MDKWDARFCELARFVAEWSKDPNAKVGAVVFARRGGDISIGYNGFPIGVEDTVDRLLDNETKQELVVHAEQNALLAAGGRTQGATIYVWGKPVCARCAGSIIQAGVTRVVALDPALGDPNSKWTRFGQLADEMFREAGVQTTYYHVVPEPAPSQSAAVAK